MARCSSCSHENPSGLSRCERCQTPLPSASSEEATRVSQAPAGDLQFHRGQVVNSRYTVLDLIGRGGMGCIYKVHDNVLGEDVALKTLLPQFLRDKMVVERFFNEARIARKLAHPNIVRVHDIGSAGKGVFISMEYVQGDSLRGIIEKLPPGRRLPIAEVLRVVDELCVALEYAHQYTIHRDIKPENIMIDRQQRIKLMDFGISKLMDNTRMTGASVVMGTPYYMSPEQLRNSRDVDARADIYSVGVVLYEVLTGNMPTGVPRPASQMLKEIPPAMDGIVAKCVDPDPEKRFQNASELRAALQPVIKMVGAGKDLDKTRIARGRKMDRGPLMSRGALGWALVLLIVAGMIGASAFLLRQWRAPSGDGAAAGPALAGRAGELLRDMETARSRVEPLTKGSPMMRELFEMGERSRTAALAARQQGLEGPSVAGPAEEALGHYLAMALARDDMVYVPGGAVTVDGVPTQLPGFLMDATEVTMGQYAKFCDEVENGWRVPAEVRDAMQAYPDYPMTYVSFFDAQAFSVFAGKSLPTRAQWALAAHGGKDVSDMYPWGGEWVSGACNCQTQKLAPVKSHDKDKTARGIYDLAGNVSEWTASPLDASKAGQQPDFGDVMLVCGGNYAATPSPLRAAQERVFETRSHELGFRCVIGVDTSPAGVAEALRRLP